MKKRGASAKAFSSSFHGGGNIGNPLDNLAGFEGVKRLEYARICVEVSAGSQIPNYIDVILCDETVAKVKVSVPWLPNSCVDCGRFGHSMKYYPQGKKVEQIYRVKGPTQATSEGETLNTLGSVGLKDGSSTATACLNGTSISASANKTSDPGNALTVDEACVSLPVAASNPEGVVLGSRLLMSQGSKHPELPVQAIDPHAKRDRGRPAKVDKSVGGGSKNKFDILSSIDHDSLIGIPHVDSGKKQRGAALSVTKIVGFNGPLKQSIVLKWAKRLHINILCLLETRVKEVNAADILSKKFEGWNYCLYGSNDGIIRRQFWSQLGSIVSFMGDAAWLVGGDFNFILKMEESSNPISSSTSSDVLEFHKCVEDLEIFDHQFIGPLYTWSNKQQNSFLARKLDRVLVNHCWSETFPSSEVEFQAPGESDHSPASGYFLSNVRDSWQAPAIGNPTHVLFVKLKRLKSYLKLLNRAYFSDISRRVLSKRDELRAIQLANLDVVTAGSLMIDELKIEEELRDLEQLELLFYKQKAKVNCCNVSTVKELLGYSLPEGASETLIREISDVEIKDALWGEGNNKSLGPDGYISFFFKQSWHIMGNDFLATIRYCFTNSFMLHSFNVTAVVLVPKVLNPSIVKHFRPISCCSIIYKIVTRILVNRLSVVFPSMISMNQSIFLKGRNVFDNTLLAQELVRGYTRKKISPRCALKIDLQKAFDSLNWDFVRIVLHALGLPEKFIGWILACITNPSYSIVFNGTLAGYFKGARGVRQGDPLSPYIFVLAMNILSSLLNVAAKKGVFSYHPKCKKVGLTHLCFADDLLIFCKGSLDSIIGVQTVLDYFYSMSGLKLNASKCEIFYAGISSEHCAAIKELTGFKLGNLLVRYLGVPLVTRKLTVKDCQSLIDKIRAKLNLWANKHLSFVGRLQLIRVVLFNMANFWCRQLALPKKIINYIEQLCSRFFWKRSDLPAGGARVSWKKHLVWFPGRIPKHSIIVWMAILNRLPTRARLLSMGLNIENDMCLMCGVAAECRDHLFFGCNFTRGLWGATLALCGLYRGVRGWDSELSWAICCLKGKSLIMRILQLAWACHVYCIWRERNYRLYGGCARLMDALLQDIKIVVRIRLMGCISRSSDPCNEALCASWGIA
ncbi:uncharacterized protein LOC120166515 [Hibiscus syriacus]|uniref:uncharacterized protein LOC120166515 n=1 Tax=Hibiscus syriacus TaxID=106335 RepID=UPI001920C9DA|nr:uncharacterized protein LOC120166515 [Hibiscus syriacus]